MEPLLEGVWVEVCPHFHFVLLLPCLSFIVFHPSVSFSLHFLWFASPPCLLSELLSRSCVSIGELECLTGCRRYVRGCGWPRDVVSSEHCVLELARAASSLCFTCVGVAHRPFVTVFISWESSYQFLLLHACLPFRLLYPFRHSFSPSTSIILS